MIAVSGLADRLRPLAERLDALTLRERIFILGGCLTLLFVAWQGLLMSPLAARARADEQRLADVRQQITVIDQLGVAASQDPAVTAAMRNRALSERLAALDKDLSTQAQGYIAPQRMTELLRALLAEQHGLKLVSLANLPVESLSQDAAKGAAATPAASAPSAQAPSAGASSGDASDAGAVTPGATPPPPVSEALKADRGPADRGPADRGPFLHPVEIVVEGDYASVVAYLRSIEGLPWRIHWRKLELTAGEYPMNRVRLVIGALSLSRDWISV